MKSSPRLKITKTLKILKTYNLAHCKHIQCYNSYYL